MKGLSHQNGQPHLVKENLDWDSGSTQAALREHIADTFSAGFVPNSGPISAAGVPCKIEPTGADYRVKIGPGVAVAPLVQGWPIGSIDAQDDTETGGERIVVTADDAAAQFDDTSWQHTSDDGLGGTVSTPQSSGAFGIPVNYSSTEGKYTYFWISYLNTVSISPADTISSKTEPGKTLFPKKTNGYRIAATATIAPPATGYGWLYIGNIYCPPYSGAMGHLPGSVVDQAEQPFSDVRSNSSMDALIAYQDDSHQSGIVGAANTLELSFDDAFTGEFSSVARVRQIDAGSAVYVDSYRGTAVVPTYLSSGVTYGYVGFSSVDDVPGTYAIYIDHTEGSTKFTVKKMFVPIGQTAHTVVAETKALIGSVYYDGSVLNAGPVYDYRSFGLTGTENVKDLAITNAKIASDISPAKVLLPSAHIIVGDAGGHGQAVEMLGDVRVSNAGITSLQDGSVTTDKLDTRAVTPAKVDETLDYTVNKLTANGGIQVTGGVKLTTGAASNTYLACTNSGGDAVWQPFPTIPGQIPAPVRWIAQGDMVTATDVVQTLIERSMVISGVHLFLVTAPISTTLSIDIVRKRGASVDSILTLPLQYVSAAQGYRAPSVGDLSAFTALQAGDRLSLNLTVDAVAQPGADLLVTIDFAPQ